MTNDTTPLAAKLRPETLDEFIGQKHLLDEGKPLFQAITQGRLHSLILWGPPGTGKTTLARMIAHYSNAHFEALSAVFSGVKDIRASIEVARKKKQEEDLSTILFVDEVHRFNKSQQDAFLPYIEEGVITFIGATTENPSFALNNALLSRARVYTLKPLTTENLLEILTRALKRTDTDLILTSNQLNLLVDASDGDARQALTLLSIVLDIADGKEISDAVLADILTNRFRKFDKGGEYFYDLISALHKSVRGSNPDASLYWFARMMDAGCDPLYIARRVVRMASEDIGNADPRALELALNAWNVQERLGSPEGELAIAQAITYLSCAAKSNAVYMAYNAALADVKRNSSLEVPLHLRNAPTQLMKSLNYSKGYRYAHDEPNAYAAGENYFPEELGQRNYYQPVSRGLEIKIKEKLAYLHSLDEAVKK